MYGNIVDFQGTCQMLIEKISGLLNVTLPKAKQWLVRRVDWAENYALPFAAIQEFFEGIYTIQFPRRKASKYGDHAVYFPGSTTTVKLYHKGLEFAKHDSKLMKWFFAQYRSQQRPGEGVENKKWVQKKIAALQRLANNRLRVEVEIHADKLDADFGCKPRVCDVTDEYLIGLHDREVKRLMREGKSGMETVRLSKDVSRRLTAIYGDTVGNRLHGFWCQLSTNGELDCKNKYAKPTFYRNRKLLTDVGVSWNSTDVKLIRSLGALPVDFVPLRTDSRLCTGPSQKTRWAYYVQAIEPKSDAINRAFPDYHPQWVVQSQRLNQTGAQCRNASWAASAPSTTICRRGCLWCVANRRNQTIPHQALSGYARQDRQGSCKPRARSIQPRVQLR